MNVINIQSEKSCQMTAKVTEEEWPRALLQSHFYWLLTDVFTAFSCFTLFKSKIVILYIFKYLFRNNIRNLKLISKQYKKSKTYLKII